MVDLKVEQLLNELKMLDPEMEVVVGDGSISHLFVRPAGYDGPALFVRESDAGPRIEYLKDGTPVADLHVSSVDDVIERAPHAEVRVTEHDRFGQARVAAAKADLQDYEVSHRASVSRYWHMLERFERVMKHVPAAPEWDKLALIRSHDCEFDPAWELLAIDASAILTPEQFEPVFDEILRGPGSLVLLECLGVVDRALLTAVRGRVGPLVCPEDSLAVCHVAPSITVRRRPGWRIDELVSPPGV